MIFADADTSYTSPIAVMAGVSPHAVDATCDTCPQGACSQCKYHGWTYTQLQPFEGFKDDVLGSAKHAAHRKPRYSDRNANLAQG